MGSPVQSVLIRAQVLGALLRRFIKNITGPGATRPSQPGGVGVVPARPSMSSPGLRTGVVGEVGDPPDL